MPASAGDARSTQVVPFRVQLLGQFAISLGEQKAAPWPRPAARRLMEFLFLSPGRRVVREVALESLYPNLRPAAASRALSQALSNARAALAPLGEGALGLLQADRTYVWLNPGLPIEDDLEPHQEALRAGLGAEPGMERDNLLLRALADEGVLLEGELYAEWALGPRERLDGARWRRALALARDRARGVGRSAPEQVVEAWEGCLAADPTCEEAAAALVGIYSAQGRRSLATATYDRCRSAMEHLGLAASPVLEEASAGVAPAVPTNPAREPSPFVTDLGHVPEEVRLISVLCAGSLRLLPDKSLGPEELKEVLSETLSSLITQVEAFGGAITSVTGAGLEAIFGAPITHEDDPERATSGLPDAVGPRRRGWVSATHRRRDWPRRGRPGRPCRQVRRNGRGSVDSVVVGVRGQAVFRFGGASYPCRH